MARNRSWELRGTWFGLAKPLALEVACEAAPEVEKWEWGLATFDCDFAATLAVPKWFWVCLAPVFVVSKVDWYC